MARITVEDCLEHVENRFKLVLLGSKRARQIAIGGEPMVEWENDKPTVVALREIAEGLVSEEMMVEKPADLSSGLFADEEDDLAAALHAEITKELGDVHDDQSDAPTPNLGAAATDNKPTE